MQPTSQRTGARQRVHESASQVPLFLFHISEGPGIEEVYNLSQFEAQSKVCASHQGSRYMPSLGSSRMPPALPGGVSWHSEVVLFSAIVLKQSARWGQEDVRRQESSLFLYCLRALPLKRLLIIGCEKQSLYRRLTMVCSI